MTSVEASKLERISACRAEVLEKGARYDRKTSASTEGPDATVLDAVAKMAEKDIGPLVVTDGEELVGIITERHYSRGVFLKGRASPTTLVREIWRET